MKRFQSWGLLLACALGPWGLGSAATLPSAEGTWTLVRLTDAAGTLQFGGLEAPTLTLLGGADAAGSIQVSGSGGCNTFRTTGVFTAGTLRPGPIASTRRACAETVMRAETRYLNLLGAARGYSRQGQMLIIGTGTARAVFTSGTEAERRLRTTGRFVGGQGPAPLTLQFTADGRVSGFAGCNRFTGPYRVTGGTLSVGPLVSTRLACPSPALQAQEQAYLRDLQDVREFSVVGTLLTLTTSGGNPLMFMIPAQ